MFKRWITILLLVGVISACSLNSPPQEDSEAMKDALVASPTTAIETPTTAPSATETISPTDTAVPTASPIPTLTPIVSTSDIVIGPDNFPPDVNPLTGLKVGDVEILERRPVSVKVQMFPRGQRPPMGVSQADIVYDFYQNTGMTRFHAIFYGEDSTQVGPIRSGRLLDRDLSQMYKSFLVFGSADQRILDTYYASDMGNRLILEWSGKCPPMCRIDPNGSNTLVVDTAEVSIYADEHKPDNSRQNLNGMSFNSSAPDGGAQADQLTVRFSFSAYNRWEYDPESGRYLRFQDAVEAAGEDNEVFDPLLDRNTNEQLSSENVVVLLVPHSHAFNSKPGNNEIVKIKLEGSGTGYAFRDGLLYEVQWNRPEKDSVLYLTLADGSAYPFKPGKTWFEVIGQTSKFTPGEDGSSYRFEWAIP